MARRILIAKPGLDGHDRGAKVIVRALQDAGHDVIYTGLHQSPEQIVSAAVDRDVDAIGVSVLSGAHMTLIPRLLELLQEGDSRHVVVFGGGIVPEPDRAALKELGVKEMFPPGSSLAEIDAWVVSNIGPGEA